MSSYNVHKIERDGNYMFRVISLSMYRTEENHSIFRGRIVKHVLNNLNFYHVFVEGDTAYGISITNENNFKKYMSQNRSYGGHLELNAETIIFNGCKC